MLQIAGLIHHKICADGNIFELLGPVLIFGIYIVAAVIKAAAKKKAGDSDPETESELKIAIEKRRNEILQRQLGQTQKEVQKQAESPRYMPAQAVEKPASVIQQNVTQWDLQKREVKRREIQSQTLQSRRRDPMSVPHQNTGQHRYTPQQRSVPKRISRKDVQSGVVRSVVSHKQTSQHKTPKHKQRQISVTAEPQNQFLMMLRRAENLRSAIILKEILDKPIALREE